MQSPVRVGVFFFYYRNLFFILHNVNNVKIMSCVCDRECQIFKQFYHFNVCNRLEFSRAFLWQQSKKRDLNNGCLSLDNTIGSVFEVKYSEHLE